MGKGWEIYVHLGKQKEDKIVSFHLERQLLASTRDLTFSRVDLRRRRLTTDINHYVKLRTFPNVYRDYARVGLALAEAKFDKDDRPQYPMAADPNEVVEVKELSELQKRMQLLRSSKAQRELEAHFQAPLTNRNNLCYQSHSVPLPITASTNFHMVII